MPLSPCCPQLVRAVRTVIEQGVLKDMSILQRIVGVMTKVLDGRTDVYPGSFFPLSKGSQCTIRVEACEGFGGYRTDCLPCDSNCCNEEER